MVERRRAALLALCLAALASIATSPAPPETTDLSDDAGGTIQLDSATPRVAYAIDVRTNAAAWPGQAGVYSASLSITANASGDPDDTRDADPVAPPAYRFIIEPIEGPDVMQQQVFRNDTRVSINLASVCEVGSACRRSYRVLLGLVDPESEPVDVEWKAEATVRYLEGAQAATAELEVTAESIDVGDVRALGYDSRAGETTIDAERPILVEELTLHRPAPEPGALTGAGRIALTLEIDRPPADGTSYPPIEAIVTLPRGSTVLHQARPWEHRTGIPVDPFIECPPDAPCDVPLVVALRWTGGPVDEGVSLAWRLEAWSATAGTADDPFALTLDRSLEIRPDAKSLTVTVSGTAELTRDQRQVMVNHWLEVPAAIIDSSGFAGGQIGGVARLHATARADRPMPEDVQVRMTLFPGDAGAWIDPDGGSDEIGADVMNTSWDSGLAYGCRSDGCRQPVGISFWVPDQQASDLGSGRITIDWTMDVRIPYFGDEAPLPGAELRLDPTGNFGW